MKKKIFIILLFLCMLLPIGTIQAKASNVPVTGTLLVTALYDKDSEEDGNDFITEAIQSIDSATTKKEQDKNYIKNFYNSSQTVMTEGLNLLKPHTILMTVINFVTLILELIGIAISFVVMVLYNFVSTSFMSTTVQGIFSQIEKVMFDWSNPNSWIIKVLVIMTIVSIGYQLVKNFTKVTNWKRIMQIVLSAFVSMSFIIFIGQSGRNIITAIESTMSDMIVQTFVFEGQDKNMEIANKENVFNVLQMQPFMIRHYGTASYNKIADNSDQTVKDAKKRVQKLLDDPSEENANKEHDDYHNNVIAHDVGSTSMVLFLSAICLIHRVLMAIILLALCVAVGAVKLMKEITLALSVYQLIWWLFRHDHKARDWFTTRLMWSIATMAVDIIFSAAMFFILQMCSEISKVSSLLMIGFDIVLLIIIIFVVKNAGTIGSKLKDTGSDTLEAMITGNASPIEIVQDMRNSSNTSSSSTDNGDSSTSNNTDDGYNDEDLSDVDHDTSGLDKEDLFDSNIDNETGIDAESEGLVESDAEDVQVESKEENDLDKNGNIIPNDEIVKSVVPDTEEANQDVQAEDQIIDTEEVSEDKENKSEEDGLIENEEVLADQDNIETDELADTYDEEQLDSGEMSKDDVSLEAEAIEEERKLSGAIDEQENQFEEHQSESEEDVSLEAEEDSELGDAVDEQGNQFEEDQSETEETSEGNVSLESEDDSELGDVVDEQEYQYDEDQQEKDRANKDQMKDELDVDLNDASEDAELGDIDIRDTESDNVIEEDETIISNEHPISNTDKDIASEDKISDVESLTENSKKEDATNYDQSKNEIPNISKEVEAITDGSGKEMNENFDQVQTQLQENIDVEKNPSIKDREFAVRNEYDDIEAEPFGSIQEKKEKSNKTKEIGNDIIFKDDAVVRDIAKTEFTTEMDMKDPDNANIIDEDEVINDENLT